MSNNMTAEFALHKNQLCIQDYLPLHKRILQLTLWDTICGLLKGIQTGNNIPQNLQSLKAHHHEYNSPTLTIP